MSSALPYDLAVVGGGAAGLGAARAARRRQARVVLVSDGPPGGDCTWVGCVPSKTLVEAARRGDGWSTAMATVRDTVARIAATETADVLRSEGIDVIEGRATLAGPGRLAVGGDAIAYRNLVLATGTAPAHLDTPALTNETVFALRDRPVSLTVVGGGPVGVELAQAFARLGSSVTVVEAAGRLLPAEEPEASSVVTRALRADGVQVVTGRRASPAELASTTVLAAIGRVPSVSGLDLAGAGVALDAGGFIRTDRHLRTSARGIYAAGDVTGRCAHTHAADEMGRLAALNALSRLPLRSYRGDCIPAVTFTDPEVARVGLTEHQAASTVPGARVAHLPLDQVDRAVTAGRTDGYITLIAGPRRGTRDLAGGRLLGATIVAERGGEMLAPVVLAMRTGMWPARLALTVQAYPTWSLGVRQAAAQLFVETNGRRARPARRAE